MKNLREILESKTREELASLISLAYYQEHKRLNKSMLYKREVIELILLKGRFNPPRTKPQMIAEVLEAIGFGNLRPEQI